MVLHRPIETTRPTRPINHKAHRASQFSLFPTATKPYRNLGEYYSDMGLGTPSGSCVGSSANITSTWRFLRPWMRGAAQRSPVCEPGVLLLDRAELAAFERG